MIVIGTQQRLPRPAGTANGSTPRDPALTPPVSIQDEHTAQVHAQELYHRWNDQLPLNRSTLNLTDLYLELWLHDFEPADTRDYLAHLDELRLVEQKQTAIFTGDPPLMQTLHTTTRGHPFYLALAASALIAARDRGKDISPERLADAPVPSRMVPGYEDEAIGDFLLSLFLHQVPPDEHDGMVFCAAPRTLDIATLRAVLQLPSDIQAREHWKRYCKLTFMRALDEKHIVFHPLVRGLLLRQLVPDRAPDSDYSRIHTRLREHFHRRGEPEDRLEEVYHALALGDPEPAIAMALEAQRSNMALWDPLREALAQAPGALIPPDIKQRATDAMHQARQTRDLYSIVSAVVLNIWRSNTTARGMAA